MSTPDTTHGDIEPASATGEALHTVESMDTAQTVIDEGPLADANIDAYADLADNDPFGSSSAPLPPKEKSTAVGSLSRPIFLTREGNTFRLAFTFDPQRVEKVKSLPYARWDSDSRTWLVDVSLQAVDTLRSWFLAEGATDVCVDELVGADEVVPVAADATLRRGSLRRPYLVLIGVRSDALFNRLRSLPGAQWEKSAQGLSYPAGAAAALSELFTRGVLSDPDKVLTPADVTISFDTRHGGFHVNDPRAATAFTKHFPQRDVFGEWKSRGFDVAFSDTFAEEVYRGEIARSNELHPDGLKETLFPYQAQSVAAAVERSGFGVYHAPGLGKTAIAIAWGLELLNRGEADRIVIVTPGAVKTQFGREITRFTGHTDVVVIDGDKKKRTKQYAEAEKARWVLLNYDLLHLDSKMITPLVNGQMLVADECHKLKGRASKRTQAMRTLALKASRRLALSGTPVENDPAEWYTIMNGFVVPGVFGSPMEFFNRYSYPGRFGGFEGARNLGELRDRSKPHYIRFRKDEVATHLPPLRVQNLVLDPDDRLAAALKRAHRDAQEEIADRAKAEKAFNAFDSDDGNNDKDETGAAMTAVGMLRLMCSSPRLVWRSGSDSAQALCEAGLIPDVDGPKVDEIRTLAIELQAAGERVVVFTSFRSMADLVAERFREDGVRYVLYTGETNTRDRDAAVQAFTTPDVGDHLGPTVFLATDAAAEGLNLGKCCSNLVNLDLPFKPSTLIQRSNRIHRVDGDVTKKYLVINYTMARTLEEGILQLVGSKADLADAILGEAGTRRATTGRAGRSVFEEALRSLKDE